ncbi:MAG: hypothetical protein M1823_001401 [Watsoniomyces obsoletus]|nr:MAG: hypothetical protein M1823_001401 [Watsoniomyces obsoletus]
MGRPDDALAKESEKVKLFKIERHPVGTAWSSLATENNNGMVQKSPTSAPLAGRDSGRSNGKMKDQESKETFLNCSPSPTKNFHEMSCVVAISISTTTLSLVMGGPPPGFTGGPPPGFPGPPPPGFENGPPPGFTGGRPPGFSGPPPPGMTGPPAGIPTGSPLQGFPNIQLSPPGVPGGPLTDWQHAHYHDSRAPAMVAMAVTFGVIATIAVITCLASKRITKAKPLAEDYTIIGALILGHGLSIIEIIGIQHGLGRHLFAVKLESLGGFLRGQYAFLVVYAACITLTKISIVLFSRRLFASSRIRYAMDATGALVVMMGIALFFGTIFQCTPVSAAFRQTQERSCFDRPLFFRVTNIFNVVIDFLILILPLPSIWRLHISWGRKVGLTGVFAFGTIACGASIARIMTLERMRVAGGIPDLTWTFADSMIWSTIEPYTGIICACLPLSMPLFRAAANGQVVTTLRSRTSKYGTNRLSRPTGTTGTIGSSGKNFQNLSYDSEKISTDLKKGPFGVDMEGDFDHDVDGNTTGSANNRSEDTIPMDIIPVKSDIEWSSGGER